MITLVIDQEVARDFINRNVEQFAKTLVDKAYKRTRYGKWPEAEKDIDGKLREAVQLLPEMFKNQIRSLIWSDWEITFAYNDCCTPTRVAIRLKPKPAVTP